VNTKENFMKIAAKKILKKVLILSLLVLASRCCFADSAEEPSAIGAWTDSTNNPNQRLGLRARLIIYEDANNSGSRPKVAYLEFQNIRGGINTMYVYYASGSTHWELRDSSGKAVSSSGYYSDGPLPDAGWLALPCDAMLRFRTAPGHMTPKNGEMLIIAGMNDCWHIPRGDTNDYYLSGTLTMTAPEGESRPPHWQGTMKLPSVKISAR
jgi:hypothetical protein